MTDDIQSMEVSGYLCTLTSAGLVGIESSRNIYVPTVSTCGNIYAQRCVDVKVVLGLPAYPMVVTRQALSLWNNAPR